MCQFLNPGDTWKSCERHRQHTNKQVVFNMSVGDTAIEKKKIGHKECVCARARTHVFI